jgi:hypothetical protein
MADEVTVDVDRLPTLTEVLELGRETASGLPAPALASACASVSMVGTASPTGIAGADTDAPPAAAPDAAAHADPVAQVLALLEPRIGTLLESRLREALAPALARAADGLIRDVQAELAPTLRSLVEEALAQALRQPRLPK